MLCNFYETLVHIEYSCPKVYINDGDQIKLFVEVGLNISDLWWFEKLVVGWEDTSLVEIYILKILPNLVSNNP